MSGSEADCGAGRLGSGLPSTILVGSLGKVFSDVGATAGESVDGDGWTSVDNLGFFAGGGSR